MFAFAAQFGVGDHPTRTSLLAPLLTLVISAVFGGLLIAVLQRIVPRIRRGIHARSAGRRRLIAEATAEARARAMMDELCPFGWRAQINLFGSTDELPDEAPDERVRVALDWAALEPDGAFPPVVRRVWADTVNEALETMIADRITD